MSEQELPNHLYKKKVSCSYFSIRLIWNLVFTLNVIIYIHEIPSLDLQFESFRRTKNISPKIRRHQVMSQQPERDHLIFECKWFGIQNKRFNKYLTVLRMIQWYYILSQSRSGLWVLSGSVDVADCKGFVVFRVTLTCTQPVNCTAKGSWTY